MKNKELEKKILSKINHGKNTYHRPYLKLSDKNDSGYTALGYAILFNKIYEIKLEENEIDYLLKNTDLNYTSKRGFNSLMLAAWKTHEKDFVFSEEQIDYLLKNTNLLHQDQSGKNFLNHYFLESIYSKLKLNQKHFDYIFEKMKDLVFNKDLFLGYLEARKRAGKDFLDKKHVLKLISGSGYFVINDDGTLKPATVGGRNTKETDKINEFIEEFNNTLKPKTADIKKKSIKRKTKNN